ncbi:MAG: hypothetical protein EXS03_00070 [Phycisphaerales bacterium]|nr:hypothetical protein [Phycisphaerales bacterium]
MNRLAVIASLVAIVVLIVTPVIAYRGSPSTTATNTLVIITPHNEQIRYEFGRAFSKWHEREYGTQVHVAWSTPGGTSEIRRMLIAQTKADLRHGTPVGGDADVLFGGGTYEFHSLSRLVKHQDGTTETSTRVLDECDWLSNEQLVQWYGENSVDGQPIYDPDKRWFGAALSTFGIVSDMTLCRTLGVKPPTRWADLADPALFGFVALVNPSQSGSVATAFETILQRLGWTKGWQVLRRAAANSNQIIAASSRIPTTVSSGESATGIAIDFYGRYQVQSLADEAAATGDPSIARLSFDTPRGESVVDADPVGILRGAPNYEMAKHFVEFCLSMDGQLLWQLPAGSTDACGHDGPDLYSLRRLPARRAAYECCESCFIDKVNPFEDQWPIGANPHFRDFVSPVFVSMAINQDDRLRRAWHRIISHPAFPHTDAIVTAADVTDPQLKKWLEAFDAMPSIAGPDGKELQLSDPAELGAIRTGWLRGGFARSGLWSLREEPMTLMRRQFSEFFSKQYESIIDSPE